MTANVKEEDLPTNEPLTDIANTEIDQTENRKALNDSKPALSGRALQRQKKLRFQPSDVKFRREEVRHEYHKDIMAADAEAVEPPRVISVADKIESSVQEMKSMLRAVSQHTSDRAVLQKIPRHMRRRAASHNRKRLPKRMHELAEEMKKSQEGSTPAHGVKRAKRRKKTELQNEYAKRSDKQGWLETHIWHAKRFHMTDSTTDKYADWGNRVALHATDKGFRACYRAVAKHCLIQDISYLRCIELSGGEKALLLAMRKISRHEFSSDQLHGREEADVLLAASQDQGGTRCIGPASVLWKPVVEGASRELHVWLHPTMMPEVLSILTACDPKFPFQTRDISGELLRFRLTGPKSATTLLSVMRPLSKVPPKSQGTEIGKWMERNIQVLPRLHEDFVTTATECHRAVFSREKTEESNGPCPNGGVFPIITNDPRLTLPLDKTVPSLTKVLEQLGSLEYSNEDSTGEETLAQSSEVSCLSPLWNEAARQDVSSSREPDHIVSTQRRQVKYEDVATWTDSLSTAVPVIAVRKLPNEGKEIKPKGGHSGPGSEYAAGWDLIVPKKWGTAFWIPLIYSKARPGGLRESKSINLEALKPHFPEDFPDTKSGEKWWAAEAKTSHTRYYRKPPAKRPNFTVLAVSSPFQPDWLGLLSDSTKSLKDTKDVDSDQQIPAKISKQSNGDAASDAGMKKVINSEPGVDKSIRGLRGLQQGQSKINVLRSVEAISSLKQCLHGSPVESSAHSDLDTWPDLPELSKDKLVCVGVQVLNKGVPTECAILSLPSIKDFDSLHAEMTDPYKYGLKSVTGPVEENHWDPYRKERKGAKKLKALRKNASKRTADLISTDEPTDAKSQLVDDSRTHFPVVPSRDTMGYVTSGRFLYSHACGAGIGFVSLGSLKRLRDMMVNQGRVIELLKPVFGSPEGIPLIALMRNVDATQYRFVKLSLIETW